MKTLGAFLFATLFVTVSPMTAPADVDEGKVDSDLVQVEGSGVGGKVMLVDLPAGGTLAVVNVAGLTPEDRYLLVRAKGGSCDIESYDESDAITDVIANASGRATATLELKEEIDEIGTISIWTAEDALVACGSLGL